MYERLTEGGHHGPRRQRHHVPGDHQRGQHLMVAGSGGGGGVGGGERKRVRGGVRECVISVCISVCVNVSVH